MFPENKKEELWLDVGCRKSLKLTSVRGKGNDPLLFIMVVALISRNISMKMFLRKGMYAKRSGHDSRQKNKIYRKCWSKWKGMFEKARTDNEPGEDRRDVGLNIRERT